MSSCKMAATCAQSILGKKVLPISAKPRKACLGVFVDVAVVGKPPSTDGAGLPVAGGEAYF